MLQRIRNRKGFTLVELMIVVAIIGILAAIAIPNFLQFRLKAKTSEAKSNLGAIRSTEVAYYAEWDFYVGGQTYTPGRLADHAQKVAWDSSTRFSMIGFAPEGQVFFDYSLDPVGTLFPFPIANGGTGLSMIARGDLDNDNDYSYFFVTESSTEVNKSGGTF